MSKNSKNHRDKRKRLEKKERNKNPKAATVNKLHPDYVRSILLEYKRKWVDIFDGLSTPSNVSGRVLEFCKSLSSSEPIYMECQPEAWSRQSCCDLNVKEYIRLHGGKMLCGYRIWANGERYVEAERHAVWINEGVMRDVSFVDTGETRTLFLPDDVTQNFDNASPKVRRAFSEDDQKLVKAFELYQGPIGKMGDAEAWDVMLSYEQWQGGERMPNLLIESKS